MNKDKETPEVRREKMRQEELKNPSSSIHGSNLADLFGGFNWIGAGIIILVLVIVGGYFLLRSTSPLEFEIIASNEDNESVIIEMVNNGFRDVKIVGISVNDSVNPLETRLQVTDEAQGFSITEDFTMGESNLTTIEEAAIKPGSSSADGTASKEDEIYGINVIHNEEIYNVQIEYEYFGMTFNDDVYINTY